MAVCRRVRRAQLVERRAYYDDWWRQPAPRQPCGTIIGIAMTTAIYIRSSRKASTSSHICRCSAARCRSAIRGPADYASAPVPDYYSDYYQTDPSYDYRYADGAIYGTDPQGGTIETDRRAADRR